MVNGLIYSMRRDFPLTYNPVGEMNFPLRRCLSMGEKSGGYLVSYQVEKIVISLWILRATLLKAGIVHRFSSSSAPFGGANGFFRGAF